MALDGMQSFMSQVAWLFVPWPILGLPFFVGSYLFLGVCVWNGLHIYTSQVICVHSLQSRCLQFGVLSVVCACLVLCVWIFLFTQYSLPGGCSLVWVFAWFLLVWDSPAQHPHISAKEKVAFICCQFRANFANWWHQWCTSEPTIRNTLRKALRAEEKWSLAEFLGATFSHQSLFGDVSWVCLCLFVCLCLLFVYASLYVCLSL